MKKGGSYFMIVIGMLAMWRCTKPYIPQATTIDYNYLIVEGTIDAGSDSTFIKLSRSVKISSITTTRPELKATVAVQSDQNNTYPLTETKNGNYVTAGLNLDNAKKYRLSIKTSNGKTYLSDFMAVKNAPPIDSIGYTIKSDGLTIYSNAHDASNSTRYYRYEYQTTWQIQSEFESKYIAAKINPPIISGDIILVPRTPDQQVFNCWTSENSSNILLASSAKLSQDVVYQNALISIPSNSEKIHIKYSILLKQYALSIDAYNFWVLMKKNTEQLGSIFDAQPSVLRGNIHNTADINEIVVGYIGVGAVASKRIFILRENLPYDANWRVPVDPKCESSIAYYSNPMNGKNDVAESLLTIPSSYCALDEVGKPGMIIGFTKSMAQCADCTLRGVNKQPTFWK